MTCFSLGEAVFSDEAGLEHMMGLVQSKRDYIKAVEDGTLNDYSVIHEGDEIEVTTSCRVY